MKAKLLPVLVIILILLNGVLIFMLIKKPYQNRDKNKERNFLIEELQFTQNQKNKFISLDDIHRASMMNFNEELRNQKDVLFNSFSNDAVNIDSIAQIIGKLSGQNDAAVFRFFKSVRKICTNEQKEKFDKIIKRAIHGGQEGPQDMNGNPPPREGGMPPPPPR